MHCLTAVSVSSDVESKHVSVPCQETLLERHLISVNRKHFYSPQCISCFLLFPHSISQTGDGFVLQDLRLLLRLKQSVRHHRFCHRLNRDGHGRGSYRRNGSEELPGQPLSRPTLLPLYQQKHRGIDDLENVLVWIRLFNDSKT